MKDTKKYSSSIILSLSIAMLLSYHSSIFGQVAENIHVQTHSSEYTTGDDITISGNAGGSDDEPRAQIQILKPDGALYKSDLVQVAPDGSFIYNTLVGGKQGINGTYQVVVLYNEQQAETAFEFETSGTLLDVIIDGEPYYIRAYAVYDHASWLDISADSDNKSLVIGVDGAEPDTLKMELDRSLIDTISNCYVVHIDDQLADSSCVPIDNETVLLTLQLPAGSHELRITGSTLVPEFGILTATILAISLVGTIAAARYKKQ